MGLVEEFATAINRRVEDGLSPEAARETRRCLLNVLGTAIGASRTREVDALVATGLRQGAGEVAAPGRSELLDRHVAALEIGFAAHFDDYDDTHLETVIHPGAATLGAVYPLALVADTSGQLELMAFALGVESQLRVGIAMSPSHYELGWHITGTAGVFGAAVAAGVLSGFDPKTLAVALGLAANFALGHREGFGTPVKPYHAGKAAMNGLFAAELASAGLDADPGVLEGRGGFFPLYADEYDLTALRTLDVAARWVLLDNTYKPFPCGIVAHPAIEAAIGLHGWMEDPANPPVRTVIIRCNPLVVELMGRTTVTSGLEARFCALHGVAVGLLFGRGGLEQFSDETARDPVVDELRRRSTLVPIESCPRESATVVVTFEDGTTVENEVPMAAGSRLFPLTDDQLLQKFQTLVEPVLPGRAAAIAEAALGLGETTRFADIARAVAVR